jgi:hypothetical protein
MAPFISFRATILTFVRPFRRYAWAAVFNRADVLTLRDLRNAL